MLWQDLLLGRQVSDVALGTALATALAIPEPRVRIVDAIGDGPRPAHGTTGLLVERTPLRGEFPLHLSLYVTDASVAKYLQQPAASLATVVRLCELLHAPCLVSDDSLDPASWLRVMPSGLVEQILLEPERLDRDEYVVASISPANVPRVRAR